MRWSEQVIAAHKEILAQLPTDRRSKLIALWESYRSDGISMPVIETALDLAGKGNPDEIELGFYVLMDLAFSDPTLQCHVKQLAKHKSATVRRDLAFYLSDELPEEFNRSVYVELLQDKAPSVRMKAIECIGMLDWKTMLPELHALRSREQNDKVTQTLDFWIPLLEAGFRVEPSQESGHFDVTVLTGNGISGKTVEASGPGDPRIVIAVEELRKFLDR